MIDPTHNVSLLLHEETSYRDAHSKIILNKIYISHDQNTVDNSSLASLASLRFKDF